MQDLKNSASSVNHTPTGKWSFDESVTDVFEDMLKRSIPQYEVMRKAVLDLACQYAIAGGHIVDVGCSRGDSIAQLLQVIGAGYHYTGLEISPAMLAAAQERFRAYQQGIVTIQKHDLRCDAYPFQNKVCVTLCVLTLQFTPIEYRQKIIRDIYRSIKPGGVLILVEKVLGASAEIDERMVHAYYSLKSENGYSAESVERKRLSLEGVLVPVTAKWNEELLRGAGFSQVDCFWRWMNFAGWLAIKGE